MRDNRIEKIVSIHASVKDATNIKTAFNNFLVSFNPRICKRCDFQYILPVPWLIVSIHASVKDATELLPIFCPFQQFQSTHL